MSVCLFLPLLYGKQSAYFLRRIVLSHVKWVPVPTAWRVLRLRMGEWPPIWRVAANVLNKNSRTADKGGPPTWGLGEVLTTVSVKTHIK
jgi:hypothetical protein